MELGGPKIEYSKAVLFELKEIQVSRICKHRRFSFFFFFLNCFCVLELGLVGAFRSHFSVEAYRPEQADKQADPWSMK